MIAKQENVSEDKKYINNGGKITVNMSSDLLNLLLHCFQLLVEYMADNHPHNNVILWLLSIGE